MNECRVCKCGETLLSYEKGELCHSCEFHRWMNEGLRQPEELNNKCRGCGTLMFSNEIGLFCYSCLCKSLEAGVGKANKDSWHTCKCSIEIPVREETQSESIQRLSKELSINKQDFEKMKRERDEAMDRLAKKDMQEYDWHQLAMDCHKIICKEPSVEPSSASMSNLPNQIIELKEEREKFRSAASVLCGAHIGLKQEKCPVCERDIVLQNLENIKNAADRLFEHGRTVMLNKDDKNCWHNLENAVNNYAIVQQRDGLEKELFIWEKNFVQPNKEQEYYARMNHCNSELIKTKLELEKIQQERDEIAMQVGDVWMEECKNLTKERDEYKACYEHRIASDNDEIDRLWTEQIKLRQGLEMSRSQAKVCREDAEVNATRAEKAEIKMAHIAAVLSPMDACDIDMAAKRVLGENRELRETIKTKNSILDKFAFDNIALERDKTDLQKQIKELERTQSICHCGIECSKHTMGDGHSAVEMEQECCAEYALDKLQAVLFDKDAFLQLEKVDTENKKEIAQKQEKVVERMLLEVNRLKFVQRWYYELLYAVSKKFQGESRHETALRYINEREKTPVYTSQTVCDGKTITVYKDDGLGGGSIEARACTEEEAKAGYPASLLEDLLYPKPKTPPDHSDPSSIYG